MRQGLNDNRVGFEGQHVFQLYMRDYSVLLNLTNFIQKSFKYSVLFERLPSLNLTIKKDRFRFFQVYLNVVGYSLANIYKVQVESVL